MDTLALKGLISEQPEEMQAKIKEVYAVIEAQVIAAGEAGFLAAVLLAAKLASGELKP